jgi:hypothetical protein
MEPLGPGSEIDGFPAVVVGRTRGPTELPAWAWQRDDLPDLAAHGPSQ